MILTNSDLVAQLFRQDKPEKAKHAQYLNEFRTQQCPMFLEHKCQFHRPFTCFHWHFPNQKRRKPLKRLDGTFNYNPDVYCTKYDENSGICPNGEDCLYVHRNAGDTERRYHPRYFKTGNCIYETTETGTCVKNGQHCAFAHGSDDLRSPVYDIREVQDAAEHCINLPASLEKERVLSEDPKWNDMLHVLAYYKTEPCKKPPRMCRQGYACPFYHNGKDKRRNPRLVIYRSTPCPQVKPGDEWRDSGLCETGEACPYCHTRTEQQFHPEIYKSTKCNDILHNGYCPRGPFCAFAHVDAEMSIGRDFLTTPGELTPSSATPGPTDNSPGSCPAKVSVARLAALLAAASPNVASVIPAEGLLLHGAHSGGGSNDHLLTATVLAAAANSLRHPAALNLVGGLGRATPVSLGGHRRLLAEGYPAALVSPTAALTVGVPTSTAGGTTNIFAGLGSVRQQQQAAANFLFAQQQQASSTATGASDTSSLLLKGRHRSGGSLSSESGLSSSSARGDTPPFSGAGVGMLAPVGTGSSRLTVCSAGSGNAFITPGGAGGKRVGGQQRPTAVVGGQRQMQQQGGEGKVTAAEKALNMEAIMGHALGDSYHLTSSDLFELHNWPDELPGSGQGPCGGLGCCGPDDDLVEEVEEAEEDLDPSAGTGGGGLMFGRHHLFDEADEEQRAIQQQKQQQQKRYHHHHHSTAPVNIPFRSGTSGAERDLSGPSTLSYYCKDESPASSGLGGSFPFVHSHGGGRLLEQAIGGGSRSRRTTGGGSSTPPRSGSFSNLPQSPIFMQSPFSNATCDLERLALQRELEDVRHKLDSREEELDRVKQERDSAIHQLEQVRRICLTDGDESLDQHILTEAVRNMIISGQLQNNGLLAAASPLLAWLTQDNGVQHRGNTSREGSAAPTEVQPPTNENNINSSSSSNASTTTTNTAGTCCYGDEEEGADQSSCCNSHHRHRHHRSCCCQGTEGETITMATATTTAAAI